MIKRKQKLNKILAISAAILLAVFSVFAVLAPQIEDSRAPISASAEEVTETSEETPEEETIYPTDNLFDINSAVKFNGSSSFSKNENQITVSQSSISKYSFSSVILDNFFLGKTITLTARSATSGINNTFFRIALISSSGALKYSFDSAVISGSTYQKLSLKCTLPGEFFVGYNLCILFYSNVTAILESGITYSSMFTDIMLNLGEVAYPYRPCNKSFYDKGYTAGESAGYTAGESAGYTQGKADGKEEGYNEGYNAASDDLNLGVLKGATVEANLIYYDNNTGNEINLHVSPFTPTFTYNGIDMGPFVSKYYYYNNDEDIQLESAQIYINFAEPFVYEQFPITFFGSSDSDVYGGYFLGTDGKKYACERDVSTNYSSFKIDENTYTSNLQVTQLMVGFGRASDTLDGCFICESGGWQNGYSAGYNEGKVNGYNDGYSAGKVFQASISYGEGYQAALAASDNGFASLLFAVVDTPIKAFTSLFDFDILGVNMKSFVLSILTFALLIAVVRFILGKA